MTTKEEQLDKMIDAWLVAARPQIRDVAKQFTAMIDLARQSTARSIVVGLRETIGKAPDQTVRQALEVVASSIEDAYLPTEQHGKDQETKP